MQHLDIFDAYLGQIGIPSVKHSGPEPCIERYLKKRRSMWLNAWSPPSLRHKSDSYMFVCNGLTREKALIVWYMGLWRGTVLRYRSSMRRQASPFSREASAEAGSSKHRKRAKGHCKNRLNESKTSRACLHPKIIYHLRKDTQLLEQGPTLQLCTQTKAQTLPWNWGTRYPSAW